MCLEEVNMNIPPTRFLPQKYRHDARPTIALFNLPYRRFLNISPQTNRSAIVRCARRNVPIQYILDITSQHFSHRARRSAQPAGVARWITVKKLAQLPQSISIQIAQAPFYQIKRLIAHGLRPAIHFYKGTDIRP